MYRCCMSDHELIEWCNKWDLLTKVQKRLITLLEESPRVGNYSDIVTLLEWLVIVLILFQIILIL